MTKVAELIESQMSPQGSLFVNMTKIGDMKREAQLHFEARKLEMAGVGKFDQMKEAIDEAKREYEATLNAPVFGGGKGSSSEVRLAQHQMALEKAVKKVEGIARPSFDAAPLSGGAKSSSGPFSFPSQGLTLQDRRSLF